MSMIRMKWLPVITAEICDGCNLCVEACGPACLEVVDNIAILTRPDLCGSEEHCIAPCPTGAIKMAWVVANGDESIGKWCVG